jgi:hypothetical protein
MRKIILLLTTGMYILLTGCSKGLINDEMANDAPMSPAASHIIVRAAEDVNSATNNEELGPVAFTGNDILWYNETTKELRFHNNYSNRPVVLNNKALSFYIDDEYLFSAMTYVSGSDKQNLKDLVFYYNATENKYFLSFALLGNMSQEDERPELSPEWSRFIEQLKKEGKNN